MRPVDGLHQLADDRGIAAEEIRTEAEANVLDYLVERRHVDEPPRQIQELGEQPITKQRPSTPQAAPPSGGSRTAPV